MERKRMDDEFRAAITSDGLLTIQECAKDGNCLFRAFSIHVCGSQASHAEIRRICYDYMEQHPDLFSSFLTDDLNTYISNQRELGKWGGEHEITALCTHCKLTLLCTENNLIR